jgi:hypothetical protein
VFLGVRNKAKINETIVDKTISHSDEILSDEVSTLLVETEHEFLGILMLNKHQHF